MTNLSLHFERDGLARITLDQLNSRANTLSRSVWSDLAAAFASLKSRADVSGLLMESAKPGIFIAGADLRELAALPVDDLEPTRAVLRAGHDVLFGIESLPYPTVALIDGACLGGGLEVALACDYRLAGTNPKVKIGLPEVKLGLIPGWGGTQRLPRLINPHTASELLRTGEHLSAEMSRDNGLIQAVMPSERLLEEGRRLLKSASPEEWRSIRKRKQSSVAWPGTPTEWNEKIATMAVEEQPAAAAVLHVLETGCPLPLDRAIEIESGAFVPLMASPAARGRIAAFLKR